MLIANKIIRLALFKKIKTVVCIEKCSTFAADFEN
jgi:hypothetical protein